jgi:hypothetical protein
MELLQEEQLLTKREVKKILKRLGDADSIELLDYLVRNMWELHEFDLTYRKDLTT